MQRAHSSPCYTFRKRASVNTLTQRTKTKSYNITSSKTNLTVAEMCTTNVQVSCIVLTKDDINPCFVALLTRLYQRHAKSISKQVNIVIYQRNMDPPLFENS